MDLGRQAAIVWNPLEPLQFPCHFISPGIKPNGTNQLIQLELSTLGLERGTQTQLSRSYVGLSSQPTCGQARPQSQHRYLQGGGQWVVAVRWCFCVGVFTVSPSSCSCNRSSCLLQKHPQSLGTGEPLLHSQLLPENICILLTVAEGRETVNPVQIVKYLSYGTKELISCIRGGHRLSSFYL